MGTSPHSVLSGRAVRVPSGMENGTDWPRGWLSRADVSKETR